MSAQKRYVARGYLIDPQAKTITHINHDTRDYKEIYKFIDADTFDCIRLGPESDADVVYVDDEGLMKDPQYFFNIDGYPQPIAGKGLVLGTGEMGDTVSAFLTFDEIKKKITFSEHKVLDIVTDSGPGWIRTRPIFGKPDKETTNEDKN